MYKELIICIIILLIIIGLNYITEKNTENTLKEMNDNLEKVKQDISQENPDKEQAIAHVHDVYNKWEEKDDVMSYYIEHNELEKVKTTLTSLRSYVETEDYIQSAEEIDKCVYILEHIYEREKLTLDNII